MPQSPSAPNRPKKRTTVVVCMIIAALGIVVWFNYYIKVTNDMKKGRLAMSGRVETDPGIWVDQNGTARKLDELKGKIVVWSCVYTTCPSYCSGIADEMKKLQNEFGSNPRFHLVSVCLYPEHDRPEIIKGWTSTKGFDGDNWWFLTGAQGTPEEGGALRAWLLKALRINTVKNSPDHIAKNTADVWTHDFVMTITDAHGNIRTPTQSDNFWHPFHKSFDNSWYPRPIREDIKKLLEEAEKD